MQPAPILQNEEQRLESLSAHAILDTLPEQDFDDVTQLASFICGVPIALVSLVDRERQWFKSKVGLDATETPRDVAFCAHAILQDDLFVVPDAHGDQRFHDNPLVTGGPHVRFYAGTPLKSADGHNLGTLCLIDNKPRQLTAEQADILRRLGRQVEAHLQLRLRVRELERLETQSRSQRDALARVQNQKDELVRLVMRDFHAPLSAIQANASYIQYLLSLPERVCGSAREIRDAAESMQRMVGNLMEASTDESPVALQPTEFDVCALLGEVTREFSQRTRNSHRQFTHRVQVSEQRITADRGLLRRTLDNLLDNSFRFTALGSGKVSLEASQPEAGLLEVRVRDEGPGIPPSTRSHLFQVHSPEGAPSAARARASNGLGLVFCRRAVEAHGGWIWVEDNHPKGVTFCLRIPVRPTRPQVLAS
ncbi:MAG TPA: GAF domain-containing sensor histidine kinase [Myxococcaceae bacterium]|jgi:signal transduction histidine kinase